MPRPCKRRLVCAMPGKRRFGPLEGTAEKVVAMTVEEFETIRLIDREGLTQLECARRMGVARTTAQAIYVAAREKLARCLTDGAELQIGGGEYVICQGQGCCCGCQKRKSKQSI